MPRSQPPGHSPDRPGRSRGGARLALQIALLAVIIAAVVWANVYAADHDLVREATRRFGYPGILIVAALSGFNLVVPIPVVAFFPFFVDVGLDPLATVLTIAVGMTIGDLLGYLVGRTARNVVRPAEDGLVRRLERLGARHPRLPLLVMFLYAAFAPLPNEIVVIPLAFLRYPVAGILAAVLAGNLIFNTLAALGVIRIFELL